jgi:adenylate kinase family enzyme
MKRILVIGSSGAGKSKLARDLGKILNLPVINLDAHFWNPGWVETPKPEWKRKVGELIKGEEWIMDGNYGGTLEMRLQAADTVIFLYYSRYLCLWQGLMRQMTRVRPDVIRGCHERINLEFIKWIWNYPRKTRPTIMKILDEGCDGKRLFICSTPRETKRLVHELKTGYPQST